VKPGRHADWICGLVFARRRALDALSTHPGPGVVFDSMCSRAPSRDYLLISALMRHCSHQPLIRPMIVPNERADDPIGPLWRCWEGPEGLAPLYLPVGGLGSDGGG